MIAIPPLVGFFVPEKSRVSFVLNDVGGHSVFPLLKLTAVYLVTYLITPRLHRYLHRCYRGKGGG